MVEIHLARRFTDTDNGYSTLRRVLLVRHGATALNHSDAARDRLRGWLDLPLSGEGQVEAWQLSMAMERPNILLCSDLRRAVETAEIVAYHVNVRMGMPVRDFRPWDIGELAGQRAIEAVGILASYADQKPTEPVPGGESFDTFRRRFLVGLVRALEAYTGTIGIVTHYRCIRLLRAMEKGGWKLDGSIDQDEFTRKGAHTAECEAIGIPVDRLLAAAAWPKVL